MSGPDGWTQGPVRVSVPATSANLGPGFDALGLALDLRDRLEAEVAATGLEVDVEGAGAGEVPRDERHLVVRAMRVGFDALGVRPPGLRLRCTNVVPHARGLGSSSAAIVGGLALSRALVADGAARLPDQTLFALAAGLEGHPDNVAPAVFGGFTVSGSSAEQGEAAPWTVTLPVDPRVAVVVWVPPDPVSTETARGLLPAQVPHADAAANAGAAALLVAALTGHPDRLWDATRDRLHQDYREPAMPASLALVRALRADGVPALVSGAGPTVLAFTGGRSRDGGGLPGSEELLGRGPGGWAAQRLEIDTRGVVLEG